MKKLNKRTDFRVVMSIPVKWQVLTDEDSEMVAKGRGMELFKHRGVPSPIEEYIDQTVPGSKDEQLYLALQFLNNKLDFIIENIMTVQEHKLPYEDHIIELCASGLKFITPVKVETGSYIKMELLMPGVVQFGMELIAEVLRVEEDEKRYVIAARIACIMDDARDSIIKIIFQKQRKDIRDKKRNSGKEEKNA